MLIPNFNAICPHIIELHNLYSKYALAVVWSAFYLRQVWYLMYLSDLWIILYLSFSRNQILIYADILLLTHLSACR